MNKKRLRWPAMALAAMMIGIGSVQAAAAEEQPGLSLGQDGAVSAQISLLQPDSTYYFPVRYTRADGRTTTLLAGEAEALELEIQSGEAVLESAEIRTWNGRCYVRLETADNLRDGVRRTADLVLRYSSAGQELEFSVTAGLRQANLSSVKAGEPVQVRSYMPLYTVAQQMELARLNSWRPVTFEGEGWSLTGTLTAKGVVDFSVTTEAIPAVERYLDGAPAAYLGFPGGGNFENGKLTIDLSRFREEFDGPVYAYRYLYGRLYRIPAVHDAEANTITLSVTNLGRYVLTGEKIPEAAVID